MNTTETPSITESTSDMNKRVEGLIDKRRGSIHPPLLALALLVGTLLLHFVVPEARDVGWHQAAGLLLVAAGVGLCVFAAAIFEARDTTKIPLGEPAVFVLQRPYTFTRNPMYLGITMTLAGLAIFFGSIVMLVAPAAFFVTIDRNVIPREEETMTRLFGQQYLDYQSRVRRWL